MYGHHLDRHLLPRLDAGLSAFPLHRAGGALAAPTPASSVRSAYCPQVVPLWLAVSNSPRQSQIPNLGTLTRTLISPEFEKKRLEVKKIFM
jgi:hypothetical protein